MLNMANTNTVLMNVGLVQELLLLLFENIVVAKHMLLHHFFDVVH